jgi:hypothetical protein
VTLSALPTKYEFDVYEDGELVGELIVPAGSAAIAEVKAPRFLEDGQHLGPVRAHPIPRDLPPLYPEREAKHAAAVLAICAAHDQMEVRAQN